MKRHIATLLLTALPLPALAGEIWVTNEKDDTISVIDIDTLEVVRTIETGERPRGITFNSDYSRVYICASDSDTVQVMDPATGEILHDLPSGEDPEQFVLDLEDLGQFPGARQFLGEGLDLVGLPETRYGPQDPVPGPYGDTVGEDPGPPQVLFPVVFGFPRGQDPPQPGVGDVLFD